MITTSSAQDGIVSSALKEGTGSASITTGGDFTGLADVAYVVEIDSVAAGAEVGSATYKWSDDGGSTWDASGVSTSGVASTLNNGVTVYWSSGSGADFVSGDTWSFKAINRFSGSKLIDWDRDTRWRAATVSASVTLNFSASVTWTAVVLYDHNIDTTATIRIKANATDTGWAAAAINETITISENKILHYMSSSPDHKYARLEVENKSNSDGYIEISELFIGPYLQTTANVRWGRTRTQSPVLASDSTNYGVSRRWYFNQAQEFNYDIAVPGDTDTNNMRTMFEALGDRDTGKYDPLYFNEDSSGSNFWMVDITTLQDTYAFSDQHAIPITMTEILRSV